MDPSTTNVMDPSPTNFPILSHVMEALPAALTTSFSSSADDDIDKPRAPSPPAEPEKPPDPEPHFELSEKMPDIKNPELISALHDAVTDVAQSRSVLEALGPRPDHETLDIARSRLSEINSDETVEDYKACKAVIGLDEMHEAYEKMLEEAERRLERIHEAVVAGTDTAEAAAVAGESEVKVEEKEVSEVKEVDTMNEEVSAILKAANAGKKAVEKVDLSGRKLKTLPDGFGRLKLLIVLNLSYNKLEVRITSYILEYLDRCLDR